MSSSFFFFQAEDGIRDYKVTGVQTCALPICQSHVRPPAPRRGPPARSGDAVNPRPGGLSIRAVRDSTHRLSQGVRTRSEERRVGKECRSGGGWDQYERKELKEI